MIRPQLNKGGFAVTWQASYFFTFCRVVAGRTTEFQLRSLRDASGGSGRVRRDMLHEAACCVSLQMNLPAVVSAQTGAGGGGGGGGTAYVSKPGSI